MKYTVMGFSQKSIVDLNSSGFKIDVADLAILRWLVDFAHTEKMVKVVDGGKTYYWVNYQAVLDDLPILNIGRRMLAVRLQKMADAGILCSSLKKNCGTFTLYGFGPKYASLITQDISGDDKKLAEGCKNFDSPDDKKFTPPMQINCHTKDPSTNDASSYNPSTNTCYGRKRPHAHFVPPTLEEVRAYCQERKNNVDPERFHDYYSANGWAQGKGKPIKDWKAAVRTWERNGNVGGGQRTQKAPSKSMQPGDDYQPTSDRIQAQSEWFDEFLKEQEGI